MKRALILAALLAALLIPATVFLKSRLQPADEPIEESEPSQGSKDLGRLGSYPLWSKVEIVLKGRSLKSDGEPNPFAIRLEAHFTSPSGESFKVPGFFDGDGRGGGDGDVWKVRFAAGEAGEWSLATSSEEPRLEGRSGRFALTPLEDGSGRLARWGRLQHAGGHYLKFAEGPYWLKAGTDDPEDFLSPQVMGGWADKRRHVDYLAEQGVNSMYLLLHNIEGDGQNVWPWLTAAPRWWRPWGEGVDPRRFDVAKLARWEELFEYIQSKGIVLHLVLEDDGAWTGFDRPLYYREMVARFGHHNALIWNLSEEFDENYSPAQIKRFARMLSKLDSLGHPLTVHNRRWDAGQSPPGYGFEIWAPFLGDPNFDMTSFQVGSTLVDGKLPQNEAAIGWRSRSVEAGRPLVISFDETGAITPADRDAARHIMWSVYLGGGNFELHGFPMRDFRDFHHLWGDLRRVKSVLEEFPFWDMSPGNEALVDRRPDQYCLQLEGLRYVVYSASARPVWLDLTGFDQPFQLQWYDPKTGSRADERRQGGDVLHLEPKFSGDFAVLLRAEKRGAR